MAGNNPGNGSRRRNFSVASNISTSSFKDNTSGNRASDNCPLDVRRPSRPGRLHVSTPNETRESIRSHSSSFCISRDIARHGYGLEGINSLSQMAEGGHHEAHDKPSEHQLKKWLETSLPLMPQQHHGSVNGEPTPNVIRAELANSDHQQGLETRARKQQEAQQRLLQLQELIQNVSLDLELNPFQQQQHDVKVKPKESSLDFLRNVPSNQAHGPRAACMPRLNVSRQTVKSPVHHLPGTGNGITTFPHYSPQNNLSHDPLMSPKRYSTSSQVNGSLLDVFGRSDPSFDSSNDDVDDNHLEGEENENLSQAPTSQILPGEANVTRNGTRVSPLERIEHQLERNNSMCEEIIAEQRRLALVTESLLSAVSNLQSNGNRHVSFRNAPGFSMSGLPVNTSWNEGGCDYQILAHAVNQCCNLIALLQRDIASIQLSLESNTTGAEAMGGRNSEPHLNVFQREPKQRTVVSAYECSNMDRFDPEVTLNNRVPPGTRTNNYWDNFRSYSRQNLLSSAPAPSNVNTSTEHHPTTLSAEVPSQLPRNNPVPNGIHDDVGPRQSRADVSQLAKRTKRKVNKGQRQVEIGVHCPPHADNRALAYGLMSVRSGTATNNAGPPPENNIAGRNLNPQNASDVATSAASTGASSAPPPPPPVEINPGGSAKAVNDNSTLNYSGARPKENRRPHEPANLAAPNVNLLAEQETLEKAQGLEAAIRNALAEHVAPPQFIAQLLQLIQKLNSDPLRQRALNALEECVAENHRQAHHASELLKTFNSVIGHHRELTPNLMDAFLAAIQLPEDTDQEDVEGAAAALSAPSISDENSFAVRQAMAPFMYRRLSQVQDMIAETLNKLEFDQLTHDRELPSLVAAGLEVVKPPTSACREDEVVEADQADQADRSCDAGVGPAARHDDTEAAVGLDEVPTRLMAVLTPPVWSNVRQSPLPNQTGSTSYDETSRTSSTMQNPAKSAPRADMDAVTKIWFPEEG